MDYNHTQRAPLASLLFAVAGGFVVAAFWLSQSTYLALILAIAAAATAFFAFCFGSMTVRDDGDGLEICYGPLPLFRKRLLYETMTSAERGRSALIDGLGIHWVPFRGWTYNLWGFDCVVIKVGHKVFRVGSDDVDNLTQFINTRLPATAS